MTVKDLIELLRAENPNHLVVLSCDAEGNGYSEARVVDGGMVFDHGQVGYARLTPELIEHGYGEDDIMDGEKCVVLWP